MRREKSGLSLQPPHIDRFHGPFGRRLPGGVLTLLSVVEEEDEEERDEVEEEEEEAGLDLGLTKSSMGPFETFLAVFCRGGE